jgi:hypothetical protein
MAIIDAHWQHEMVSEPPAGLTVRHMHQQVCVTRSKLCGQGRRRTADHARRRRHRPVSRYRVAGPIPDTSGMPSTPPFRVHSQRRAMLMVLILTVGLGLLFLVVIPVLEPGISDRLLLLGALLIAVAGAVVLNAISLAVSVRARGQLEQARRRRSPSPTAA